MKNLGLFLFLFLVSTSHEPLSAKEPGKNFTLEYLQTNCPRSIGESGETVKLMSFKKLVTLGDQTFYASLCGVPKWPTQEEQDNHKQVLSAASYAFLLEGLLASADVRQIWSAVDGDGGLLSYFDTPQSFELEERPMLVFPQRFYGTGGIEDDHYFVFENKNWEPVNSKKWQADLFSKLPKNFKYWKSPAPEVAKGFAEVNFLEGGTQADPRIDRTVQVSLKVVGHEVVMNSFKILPREDRAAGRRLKSNHP